MASDQADFDSISGGRYVLADRRGFGTSAVVYVGVSAATGEKFAIKAMRKLRRGPNNGAANRALERMQREIAILRGLPVHPHIVSIRDVLESEQSVYVVMDLAQQDLLSYLSFWMDRGRTCPELVCRLIAWQLVDGIVFLHERGIVHRDLKPENILVDVGRAFPEMRVRITDFGLSRESLGAALMETMCGTPAYVAPEVLLREGYGSAVDVWSLGVVLYTMVSGYNPWDPDAPLDVQILGGRCEFPVELFGDKSPHVVDLIRQLLDVNPKTRLAISAARQHPWFTTDEHLPSAVAGASRFIQQCMEQSGLVAGEPVRPPPALDTSHTPTESASRSSGSSLSQGSGPVVPVTLLPQHAPVVGYGFGHGFGAHSLSNRRRTIERPSPFDTYANADEFVSDQERYRESFEKVTRLAQSAYGIFQEYHELLTLLSGLIDVTNELGRKLQSYAHLPQGPVGASRRALEDLHVNIQLRLLEIRTFNEFAKTVNRVLPWHVIASQRGLRFWTWCFRERLSVPLDEFVRRMERMSDGGRFSARVREHMAAYIDSSQDGIVSCVEFGNFLRWTSPWETCIPNMERLLDNPWFWGFISKEEADTAVAANLKPGVFVVRFSTSVPGAISVTFATGNPPNIVHTQLTQQVVGAEEATVFTLPWDHSARPSVPALVEGNSHLFDVPVTRPPAIAPPPAESPDAAEGLPEGTPIAADRQLDRFRMRTAPLPPQQGDSKAIDTETSSANSPDAPQGDRVPPTQQSSGSLGGASSASAPGTPASPQPARSPAAARAPPPGAIMSGALRTMQRRGPFNSWKRRWVVLRGAELVVCRGRSDGDATPKRVLPLCRDSSCGRAPKIGPNVFECQADAHNKDAGSLVLQAESGAEAESWLAAIARVIQGTAA